MQLKLTSRWRSRAGVCAVALLLLIAPAAGATDADPWLGAIARQLRQDPVHVSDSVSRAVSAAEAARLRAAVRAMPVLTRVAIISGAPGDVQVEGPHQFELPQLLPGAIDRPGIYLVAIAGSEPGSIALTVVGPRIRVTSEDVERAVTQDMVPGTRIVAQIRYALRFAATGERPLRGAAERARRPRRQAR